MTRICAERMTARLDGEIVVSGRFESAEGRMHEGGADRADLPRH